MENHANTSLFFQELYRAFNNRLVDTVLASFHPEVDWPASTEGDGRVIGHDAVRAYWLRQWEAIAPLVQPLEIRTMADGQIKVRVHQLVRDKEGNELFDGQVLHVYRLVDGLIVSMEIEEV